MQQLKKLEDAVSSCVHIALPPAGFASEKRKSGMCMTAVLSTFPFRDPFATCSWRKGWLKSISGFPIQGGLRFGFEVIETYSTQCG